MTTRDNKIRSFNLEARSLEKKIEQERLEQAACRKQFEEAQFMLNISSEVIRAMKKDLDDVRKSISNLIHTGA